MIIRLYFLLLYIIEGGIFLQYCSTIFEFSGSKLRKNLTIAVLYLVLFFISFLNQPAINTICFAIVNFIFLLVIYHVKGYIAFFHSILSTAIMCLSEMAVIAITPHTISFSFSDFDELYIWIIPSIMGKIFYFLVMHLISNFSHDQKSKSLRGYKAIILLGVIPFISIFISFTFLSLCVKMSVSPVLAQMVTISTLLLLLLNVIIWEFYRYTDEKNTELMSLQLSLQKESDVTEYYKKLIEQSEEQRHFVHDIKKHLQSIAFLNEKGEKEKIKAYINTLIFSPNMKATTQICNNEFLNVLISRYVSQCDKLGIAFCADIRNGVCGYMKENDMTSLFCNLLDNAVEAAAGVFHSCIDLSIYEREENAFTVIALANSCVKDPFSLSSKKTATTKRDKLSHGYGLKIISRIVKNYNGEIQQYYSYENQMFHTIITLKR